jgi:Nuclease-related domain
VPAPVRVERLLALGLGRSRTDVRRMVADGRIRLPLALDAKAHQNFTSGAFTRTAPALPRGDAREHTHGMRSIELSDHAGDLLAKSRRTTQARSDQRYRRDLAAHERSVADARQRRDQARAQGRLLTRLRWGLTAFFRGRRPAPRPTAAVVTTDDEGALEGGVRGEQEAAQQLGRKLNDAWLLIKGYRNNRGEIDYLLLGPGGLFAIEVKYVNGTFSITREQWRYVKFDNYGNPVGEGVIEDGGRRRRPPNIQLAEPAEALEGFLARFGQPVPLDSVVLLNHPKARIARCDDDLGVRVLTSADRLARLALAGDAKLSKPRIAEIEQLIRRDHDFHNKRRPPARHGR